MRKDSLESALKSPAALTSMLLSFAIRAVGRMLSTTAPKALATYKAGMGVAVSLHAVVDV